ncbi:MAG TPA: NAD-binding protein [Polyangiaceae bacterium]|nr:NAD-binding protein [Polyangiaceae bacterium]
MPHRSEYVIICGANLLASHTADYLIRLGCKVTLVVPAGRMTTLRFARTLALERIVEGDCRELDVLRDAGLLQATAVLLLHDSDLLNIEAALKIREQRKRVRIVSRIFQRHLARSIDEAIGHHYSLSDSVLAAPAFALAATLSSYAGYFYLEDPAQPTEPLQLWEVAEIELDDRHPLVGKEPKQLELEHATLVVARRPASEPQPEGKTPIFFPPHDTESPLCAGERIMVLARPDRARTVLHTSMPGPTNLWGNKPRRRRLEATLPGRRLPWHRSAFERMLRVSPVMKLVGAALAALLVLGMATFAFAGVPGADTLFYTIVVLTGGYGDLQLLQHPATSVWVKAVASALTMLGAGLVGLVYGVMTEQVLGRSLGTILLDRRIPRQGHVIVCGLGNIGVRVVEELHRMGIPVVVIEKNHDNPHMHAVRRLKIPVIESSAASPGVLTRARVEKAHCLVGATDDDLANLDVALAARALCDPIRVVLRVFDQGMVQPLQKMFGIDVTYSVWMLAAPAFAAAALVGRTFGSFRWKQRSVLVQELIVPPESPIVGHPLEQVCEQYDVRAFFRGRFLDGGQGQASIGIIESGARVVFLGTSDAMRRIANVARPADDEAPDSEAPASTVG